MVKKKNNDTNIRSSAAEYLTFVAASGESGAEAVYADEDVWLSQKMMAVLYNVYNSRVFCTRWNGLNKGSIFDDALDDKEFEGNLIYLRYVR